MSFKQNKSIKILIIIIFISIFSLSYNLYVYSPNIKIKNNNVILNKKFDNLEKEENYLEKKIAINKSGTTLDLGEADSLKIENIPPIITHIKTPEKVKSIYYTSYSASKEYKIKSLVNLTKETEINSVIIDIKNVNGYVSFNMDNNIFDKIKPISNNQNKNIKELIKELHKNNIYVIARIAVFKDKLLSKIRQDLAIKRKDNNKVWTDYKGQKYLDPYSKEVWDYNSYIAESAYNIGFDEINFDYVRFPTDGYISNISYIFSNKILKENKRYGKIIIIDKFSNYITSKLRKKYPKIVLSADIFGLAIKNDMLNIGQSLESFILYFDYIMPMVYPSHYSKGYLGYKIPDNYPYKIIKDSLNTANAKILKLNNNIKKTTLSGTTLKIKNKFIISANIKNLGEIKISKIRPWLQGFSCTWCKGYIPYNRIKFRKQIKAVEDSNLKSWSVWNSASNYYIDWYNKN